MASSPTRINIAEFEYQIKMFSAIFKSSLREQLNYILYKLQVEERETIITDFLNELTQLLQNYRALVAIIKVP